MSTNLFIGQKIRLSAPDIDKDPALIAAWSRDPDFVQMLSSGIARPWTTVAAKKEMAENLGENEPKPNLFSFLLRTLEPAGQASRLIGLADLSLEHWSQRDAFIGIGLGERADWGQGYGTDAMRLILRYAFDELNLRRITLTVFEYNERAQRTYRKLGFQEEGRLRQRLNRYGRRWDMLFMGLLREEWKSSHDT